MQSLCRRTLRPANLQIRRSYTAGAPGSAQDELSVPSLKKSQPESILETLQSSDDGIASLLARSTTSGRAATSVIREEHLERVGANVARRRAERLAREAAAAASTEAQGTNPLKKPKSRKTVLRPAQTSQAPADQASTPGATIESYQDRLAKIRSKLKTMDDRRKKDTPARSTRRNALPPPPRPTRVQSEAPAVDEIFYSTVVDPPSSTDPAASISKDLSDVFPTMNSQRRLANAVKQNDDSKALRVYAGDYSNLIPTRPDLYGTPVQRLDILAQIQVALGNNRAVYEGSRLSKLVGEAVGKYQRKTK